VPVHLSSGINTGPLSSDLHTSYPAFEDGTDRWFRNVGIQKSDAGDTPKRLLKIFKTRQKFEIKNAYLYILRVFSDIYYSDYDQILVFG
jgi:hypothetical protein